MKTIIIERIDKFKIDEENFKTDWWKNVYVSFEEKNNSITKHISDVNFDSLNDNDLVRLFEFIILQKNEISVRRVNNTYF
jgi:hypothetical protein